MGDIWVYGDWRNYYQNRVSLQLLAKARELAPALGGRVCAVVMGSGLDEWVREYAAHGADAIYVVEDERLAAYLPDTFARVLEHLARLHRPEVLLLGATAFGKELAARTASRLGTGLTADCVELSVDEDGVFVQVAPAYGGEMMAEIVIERHRPQMATVRPGVFAELPHDDARRAEIIPCRPPEPLPASRLRLMASRPQEYREQDLERAEVVVCGGRGLGDGARFARLGELARLLGAEVGATRPAVYLGWAAHDALVGQAGRHITPRLLVSLGVSGAVQHTAGIDAGFTVAVNTNPRALMMRQADVALVGDAAQVCEELIRQLGERLAGK